MNITPNMIEAAARAIATRMVANPNHWREWAELAEWALTDAMKAEGHAVTVAPEVLDAEAPDAATISGWSDRDPATIVRRTATTLTVQRDRVTNMSGPDHDAHANGKGQVTIFQRDTDAPLEVYTLRDNGRWKRKGDPKSARGGLTVGRRDYYRDPSF